MQDIYLACKIITFLQDNLQEELILQDLVRNLQDFPFNILHYLAFVRFLQDLAHLARILHALARLFYLGYTVVIITPRRERGKVIGCVCRYIYGYFGRLIKLVLCVCPLFFSYCIYVMYGSTFSSLFNLTCLSFSPSSFPLPSLVDVYCPHNYCGSCVDFMFIVIVFFYHGFTFKLHTVLPAYRVEFLFKPAFPYF